MRGVASGDRFADWVALAFQNVGWSFSVHRLSLAHSVVTFEPKLWESEPVCNGYTSRMPPTDVALEFRIGE